jgi:hypothetical protein
LPIKKQQFYSALRLGDKKQTKFFFRPHCKKKGKFTTFMEIISSIFLLLSFFLARIASQLRVFPFSSPTCIRINARGKFMRLIFFPLLAFNPEYFYIIEDFLSVYRGC